MRGLIQVMRRASPVLFAALVFIAAPADASDDALSAPTGRVILSVEGAIGHQNDGDKAVFDSAMLEELGTTSFVTSTPWFSGPVEFEGVPLQRVLDAVGASGDQITAVALNDYSAEIPIESFEREVAIIALKRDGEYMDVSDKGPLFIVYPYDSDPELDTQKYYARSVWQLSRMVVE